MTTVIDEDKLFGRIVTGSLGLLAVLTIAALTMFSKKAALGVLAGGTIAVVNFFWLRSVLQRILGQLPARPVLQAQLKFVARISVTGFIIYLIIVSGWFSLTGLIIGLSVIVANIIALSLYGALRPGG